LRFKQDYIKLFPKPAYEEVKNHEQHILNFVDDVLFAKKENIKSNTSNIECKIDKIIYRIYDL